MQDTAKYLIHADITADGVVERSDVVGAIFGQTEGLLGDDLDLRDLQDSSKVGRIDVDVDSQNGQSYGSITIATSLDKVETAILAAALETIDRVGPCRSTIAVETIEDVRAAKRREIVERAKVLLSRSFDGAMPASEELIREVRESVRVEDITDYEGFPAGPRASDSDAVIVVEGRADVLQLLKYGIKNAVAVEGTNVPDAVADLTRSRTVTAFLDGDRGGDLILKELAQVGEVDHVAFAPPDRSVEDLDRHEILAALRDKVPYEAVAEGDAGTQAVAATDGSTEPAPNAGTVDPDSTGIESPQGEPTVESVADATDSNGSAEADGTGAGQPSSSVDGRTADGALSDGRTDEQEPTTLREHVEAVVHENGGTARLLSADQSVLAEADADETFDLLREADEAPAAVVIDGELSQRVLDVAAQRGVGQIVAASTADFVKQPTSVRVRTADQLQIAD